MNDLFSKKQFTDNRWQLDLNSCYDYSFLTFLHHSPKFLSDGMLADFTSSKYVLKFES